MTRRRRLCLATVAAVVVTHLAADSAMGEVTPSRPLDAPLQEGTSFLHLLSPASVVTDGGTSLCLAPGYYLDEPAWTKLDTEFRRLQEQETRLTAENRALRETTSSWQPGWKTLTLVLVVGFAGGVYASSKF